MLSHPNGMTMKTYLLYHLEHYALRYLLKKICSEKAKFDLIMKDDMKIPNNRITISQVQALYSDHSIDEQHFH